MLEYLSRQLGEPVDFVQTLSYDETQEGFVNGVLDFGILNAFSYLEIEESETITAVAERMKRGRNSYSCHILVRADSPVKTLEDLKGRVFAFGDPSSTSSSLIPHRLLLEAGVDPNEDLAKFFYIPKQDSLLYAILNRTADAGAVASFIFEEQEQSLRSHFRILANSEPFPLGPFVVSRRLEPEMIERIRRVLLSMGEDPLGRAALESADLEGFVPFRDEDFNFLRRISRGE